MITEMGGGGGGDPSPLPVIMLEVYFICRLRTWNSVYLGPGPISGKYIVKTY